MWIFEHYENEFISQLCLSDAFNLSILMGGETQRDGIQNRLVKLRKEDRKILTFLLMHVPIWCLKFLTKMVLIFQIWTL